MTIVRKPKNAMQLWTNRRYYGAVQAYMRGYYMDYFNGRSKTTDTPAFIRSMQRGMNRYFQQQALRAPNVPPGESNTGTFYRYITMSQAQFIAFCFSTMWTDKGYMAFSSIPARPGELGIPAKGKVNVLFKGRSMDLKMRS